MMIVERDIRTEYGGTTVASGAAPTVILGPFNLARYPVKTITIYNQGPTQLSGVLIEVNPDQGGFESGTASQNPLGPTPAGPGAGLWETYGTLQNIPSSTVKSLRASGDAHRWWRVRAVADLTTLSVSGWIHAGTL